MAIVYLCSLPTLSNDYHHTIDFNSIESQRLYFNSKVLKQVNGNVVVDTLEDRYILSCTIQSVKDCDYLFVEDSNKKRLYYFITGKRYKTTSSTIVDLEIDVLQTYMFNYNLLDSFVDRCHVNRWNPNGTPTSEIVYEDIEYGDNIVIGKEKLCTIKKQYLITSTVPLGTVEEGGGEIPIPFQGIPSARGYRFIKGYEGFAPYPFKHGNESFNTGGYGITEIYQTEYYNAMKPFPTTEEKASIVYGLMLRKNFAEPLLQRLINDGVNTDNIKSNHFDAFVSICMNCGLGAVVDSPMYKYYIKDMSDSRITDSWLTWYIQDGSGNVLQGLKDRRKAESNIFSSSVYDYRQIIKYNENGDVDGYVLENNGNGFIPEDFKGGL